MSDPRRRRAVMQPLDHDIDCFAFADKQHLHPPIAPVSYPTADA